MSSDERVGQAGAGARCAYLILSHKNPGQIEALSNRILELSPVSHIVVHHDRDGGRPPWDGQPPARVHLVDRRPVEWGGWSIVDASLRLIRFAREQLDAQWMVIVSGEHWPVTDLSAWEERLRTSGVDALMPAAALPARLHFGKREADGNRDLARCRHRWFRVRRPRITGAHKALSALSKLGESMHPMFKLEFSLRNESWFIGLPRRRGPVKPWTLYKGSEWFACNARAATVLLAADQGVTSWFQRSHIPDESYFQSLLYHHGGFTIESSLVTWVPPQPATPTPGWMLLKPQELPLVFASAAAFARKIDPERNPEVQDAIDAHTEMARAIGTRP
jgi:hypothetical protein